MDNIIKSRVTLKHFDYNDDFLKYLADLCLKFSVNKVVDEFAKELNDVKSIFEFCRSEYKYEKDPVNYEKIQLPDLVITMYKNKKKIGGDCDDKVLLLGSLLLNRGYKIRLVGAHYTKGGGNVNDINHVYLEYFDNDTKKWIPLDPAYVGTFGTRSSFVIPLKYFIPSYNMLAVSNKIDIGAYHTDIMHKIGLIRKSDIPYLQSILEITPDEKYKEILSTAISYIEKHSYLTPDDANILGAENVHKILTTLSPVKGFDIIKYEDIDTSVSVEPITLAVAGIVIFAVGTIVAKMLGATWKQALSWGLVAVAVAGAIYIGWQYAPAAIGYLGSLSNNSSDNGTKNYANVAQKVIENGGQVSGDPQTNKNLTQQNNQKTADNIVLRIINGFVSIMSGGKDGVTPTTGEETTYYNNALDESQNRVSNQNLLLPILGVGGIATILLLVNRRKQNGR